MIKRTSTWLAVAFIAVACSSSSTNTMPEGGTDGGGKDAGGDARQEGGAPSITQACADYATALCDRYKACSNVYIRTHYAISDGGMSDCETRTAEICVNALMAPSTGNSAESTEACAKALPMWECHGFLDNANPPAACASRTGSLAMGATCEFPAQCETGFCAIAPNAACGTCQPAPKFGDSCANLTNCGQGLACDPATNVCRDLRPAGAQCDRAFPCSTGLSCVGASMTAKGKCEREEFKLGATCDPTLTTGPGCALNAGLTCNQATKKCEKINFSGPGEPCGRFKYQLQLCEGSTNCNTQYPMTGKCVNPNPDNGLCLFNGGAGCDFPARCVSDTPDGGTGGRCRILDWSLCR